MFQPLIDDARDMIGRLHQSAERGRENVPSAVMMRFSEFQAWEMAVHNMAQLVFGDESPALLRWQSLVDRRDALMAEAMRKDVKRGEYYGMIDYFHLAIGALREFEATYQYHLAARTQAPEPAMPPEPPPYTGSQPLTPYEPAAPRQRVTRLADNQWELLITLADSTYGWLSDVVAAREASGVVDPAAVARLAATIVERVSAQTRRGA